VKKVGSGQEMDDGGKSFNSDNSVEFGACA